jgi:hypothetical protein
MRNTLMLGSLVLLAGNTMLRFPAPAGAVTEGFNAPWIESFILCG